MKDEIVAIPTTREIVIEIAVEEVIAEYLQPMEEADKQVSNS